MKQLILLCSEIINIIFNYKKKYIVEIVQYLDNDGNNVSSGTITQNENLVDKFETETFSRRLAYKIGRSVNLVKYDGKYDIRIYE